MTQEQAIKKVKQISRGLNISQGTFDTAVKMLVVNKSIKTKIVKGFIERNIISKPLTNQEIEDMNERSKRNQLPSSMR